VLLRKLSNSGQLRNRDSVLLRKLSNSGQDDSDGASVLIT
jgi:hypothetical protein